MLAFKSHLCAEKTIAYDGTPLSPHWIYRQTGTLGNAVMAFTGPADVSLDHMVDLEDVRNKAPIGSPSMLHFLGEWFVDSLDVGILLQHLLVFEVVEELLLRGVKSLTRRGNDIYIDGRKLSVSIATRSPVSVLVHMGINIDTEGTPVPTSGLRELGIEALSFAQGVLDKLSRDAEIWSRARVKVLPR